MTTQTNQAVTTAVQNTTVKPEDTTLNGKTMGQVVNDVDRTDLKKSYKAIDEAYDIVIRKDGYDDTAKKLEGLKDQISEKVYDVLKLAMTHCEGKIPIAKAYFAALCKKAEEYFLSKYTKENKEETTIAKAIPLWPAYKSSMLKGLDYGMSPEESIPDTDAPRWPTAAKYRTEVQKREKDGKSGTGSQAGNERNSSSQTTTVVNLVTKGWSPMLAASMNALCDSLNQLTHEEQDQFAPELLAMASRVSEFHQKAKTTAPASGEITTDADGNITGTTRSDSTETEVVEPAQDPGTVAALQAAIDKPEVNKGGKRRGAKAA